ncbi:MAG: response regulator [Candidatus Margulisiibacteriota bacterium]
MSPYSSKKIPIPNIEAIRHDFKEYHRKLFVERLNVLLFVAIIVIPLFGLMDVVVTTQYSSRFLVYRAATCVIALLFLLFNNTKIGFKMAHATAMMGVIVMTVRITAMTILLGGEESSYYITIIITMLWVLSILPCSVREAIFYCTVAYIIYIAGLLMFDPQIINIMALISNNFFLLVAFSILCSAAYFNHKSRFQEFQLRRELRESRGQITKYANNLEEMVEQRTDEKIKLEQRLFHMQKMEAIGTMAGGIAHDFNNLLWTVLGYTSFIKTIRTEDKELNEHLEIIENSAKQASGLTKQLLALSRKDNISLRPLNLGEVIHEASTLLDKSIKRNVHLILDIHEGLKTAEVDAHQVEQAIINLGINADHAMPKGGKLEIEVKNCALSKAMEEMPAGDYICIAVADSGQGIPEKLRLKIFEPFFTTKQEGIGTGMGLAMVYRMIKNHNGFIRFDSTVDKGTTFFLYFPASDKKAQPLKDKKETGKITKGEGTILVIDNEDQLRIMLAKIIQTMGYKVLQAENGEKAIQIYEKERGNIDLIILDMHMPGLDGHETYFRLRNLNPEVKVIVSTGYIEAEEIQELFAAGVIGTLEKPYGVNEISKKLQSIIGTT